MGVVRGCSPIREIKMRIREDTENLFDQDNEYVIGYLNKRGLDNAELNKIIREYPFGLLEEAKFFVGNDPYELTHFLSKSDTMGYDIRKVNALLKTNETDDVVFAVVLGDDAVCCNVTTGEVYIWLIQSGEGERIDTGLTLTDFLNNII
mgnify:CR=1 FL=1